MKQFLLILFVTFSGMSLAFGETAKSVDPTNTEPEISIFPNPTTHYFELKNGSEVKKVIIYNLFGTQVKSFMGDSQKRYDILDLANGMYLIQMFDSHNNIITTRRLSKK